MIDKEKATVTMSLRDYEDLASSAKFWEDKYNRLDRLIRQFVRPVNIGDCYDYYIPNANIEPLTNSIVEYLHDCDC